MRKEIKVIKRCNRQRVKDKTLLEIKVRGKTRLVMVVINGNQ